MFYLQFSFFDNQVLLVPHQKLKMLLIPKSNPKLILNHDKYFTNLSNSKKKSNR